MSQTTRFGLFVEPLAVDPAAVVRQVQEADRAGIELIGIQDHPYQRRQLDTFSLIAHLLAVTERIHIFPAVANLPLRPPAMIANAGATLDLLSGGRFELGIGSGAFLDPIVAMGGPRRTPGQSVAALEEAVQIIRAAWSGQPSVRFEGEHYRVDGYRPGPPPAHPIGIWIGAYKPRMLRLTGRYADGWFPSQAFAPPEAIPALAATIDAEARAAGRPDGAVKRIYNISGTITDGPDRGGLEGPIGRWVETLTQMITDLTLDAVVLWSPEDAAIQAELFVHRVVPEVRRALAAR